MDIKVRFSADEIRNLEEPRLREVEKEIRTEVANLKMDIYQAAGSASAQIRNLKRNLACTLTVKNERKRKAAKGESK